MNLIERIHNAAGAPPERPPLKDILSQANRAAAFYAINNAQKNVLIEAPKPAETTKVITVVGDTAVSGELQHAYAVA